MEVKSDLETETKLSHHRYLQQVDSSLSFHPIKPESSLWLCSFKRLGHHYSVLYLAPYRDPLKYKMQSVNPSALQGSPTLSPHFLESPPWPNTGAHSEPGSFQQQELTLSWSRKSTHLGVKHPVLISGRPQICSVTLKQSPL